MSEGIQDPLFTEREWLEGMTVEGIVDYIIDCGAKATTLERSMNLASEVLEGYGTSVEQILTEREKQNGSA